jgi:hypothetical protein
MQRSIIEWADTRAVLQALWKAAGTIIENEDPGNGYCRYCAVEDYPVDQDGNPIEDAGEATEFHMDHEEWCPSYIIDHAFDGLERGLASRVISALGEGR